MAQSQATLRGGTLHSWQHAIKLLNFPSKNGFTSGPSRAFPSARINRTFFSKASDETTPKRKANFYGVRVGKEPGVYDDWEVCKQQVLGFSRSEYKRFSTRTEAESYVDGFLTNSQTMAAPKTELMVHQTILTVGAFKLPGPPIASLKKDDGWSCAPEAARKEEVISPQLQSADDHTEYIKGTYQIEFDGASKGNPGPAGAGALLRCPHGEVVLEVTEGLGKETNNVAEYRSLIRGLKVALSKGIRRVRAQGDSKLVCLQVAEKWKVQDTKLIPLMEEVKILQSSFEVFSIVHVLREHNAAADALANEAVHLREPVCELEKPQPNCCRVPHRTDQAQAF